MSCPSEEKQNEVELQRVSPNKTKNSIRNTIYSVGVDQTLNLKEKIADVHGSDSQLVKAVSELERYIGDPETRKSVWFWNFYKRVESGISRIYPHANYATQIRMAQEFIEELINGGYIRTLQSLSYKNGANYVSFARGYADHYSVSIGAALLFGPRGGAYMELLHFIAAEKVRGQHRYGLSPDAQWSDEAKTRWYQAQRQINWPTTMNQDGERVPLEVADQQGCLPEGTIDTLRELWRRNPALRYYTGTNRLSGDIPYQIIEDVVDMMLQGRFSPLNESEKTRYNRIVEQANQKGMDPFYAVYRNFFTNKEALRRLWNRARQWLYNYSLLLWETQNEIWLADGKRAPANGVVYKPAKTARKKSAPKKKIPGTIYLNNGRYYWMVAGKMKPQALVDEKTIKKVPGTIFLNHGLYYWMIAGKLKRQRLVPKGEKYSTTDRATAQRIAARLWARLQKENPKLAAKIRHMRSWGTATKDRATAERIALKMWRRIKKSNPEFAAKILQDNRPKAKDHWVAQIVADGEHRHIGTYGTWTEAEVAYVKEFKKTFGYPPGYNVQCIPKMDKVWPTWAEEKARLALMDEHPRMPVIGQSAQAEPLKTIVERMQKVDWLVKNCILVFDENSPVALPDIAIQSQGERWHAEIKKQGKRPVVKGTTSIDRDTGRIRITIYGQGFREGRVLTEEIYHIIFEIIRRASPKTFASIEKWYSHRLKKGLDPTWQMYEAFAELMVQEEESPRSSDLPRGVVKYAQKTFSAANSIPEMVMEKIKAE